MWHLDLFRITSPEDVWELGWRELGAGNGIVLVEWPERAGSLMPPDRWDIRLDAHPTDPGLRVATGLALGSAPPIPPPADD